MLLRHFQKLRRGTQHSQIHFQTWRMKFILEVFLEERQSMPLVPKLGCLYEPFGTLHDILRPRSHSMPMKSWSLEQEPGRVFKDPQLIPTRSRVRPPLWSTLKGSRLKKTWPVRNVSNSVFLANNPNDGEETGGQGGHTGSQGRTTPTVLATRTLGRCRAGGGCGQVPLGERTAGKPRTTAKRGQSELLGDHWEGSQQGPDEQWPESEAEHWWWEWRDELRKQNWQAWCNHELTARWPAGIHGSHLFHLSEGGKPSSITSPEHPIGLLRIITTTLVVTWANGPEDLSLGARSKITYCWWMTNTWISSSPGASESYFPTWAQTWVGRHSCGPTGTRGPGDQCAPRVMRQRGQEPGSLSHSEAPQSSRKQK